MALEDEALKYLKGKQVVVGTTVQSEGYIQEISGTLIDGGQGYLVVQEGEDNSPTIVNSAHVAWVYEETEDDEDGEFQE